MSEGSSKSQKQVALCERCEARTVETASRLICDAVCDLLPLYQQDEEDCAESAGGAMPDRDRVIEALTLLLDVLLPGKATMETVENGLLAPFLEERLARAFRLLRQEIALALPFRWRGEFGRVTHVEPDVEDVEAEANRIMGQLFRQLPTIRRKLIRDIQAAYDGDPAALCFGEVMLAYPGVRAIASHRIAHELYALRVPIVSRVMSEWTHTQTGIDIHPGAQIGESFFIDHGTGVVIGETARIGNNVKLYQGVTLGAKSFPLDEHGHPIKGIQRHPTVEDDVVIYAGATILGGDTVIGRGSTIGGNVFLLRSVPPGTTVLQKAAGLEMRGGDIENGTK